jgi:hypothetical protein
MELNEFLQPLNAPVTQSSQQVTGYDFLSNNERGALISQSMFGTAVIGGVNIKDAAIGSANIQDLAVTTAKLGSASVTSIKIGGTAVTNDKISSVGANKLSSGTISSQIALGSANILLDGTNNRILIYDGTANRVALGNI